MRLHIQIEMAGMQRTPGRRVALFLLVAVLTFVVRVNSSAQERAGSDPQEGVRRQALLAVEDLFIDTRDYDDRGLTARIRAQIADFLWAADALRAAQLIEAAFDDAAAIDEKEGTDSSSVRRNALGRGEVAEAEETAASQLSEERQAVVYLELARASFKRGDRTRAEMQLAAAQAGAEKAENPTQRASALIHLAFGVADQDVQRAFSFTEWAVKEIDRLDKFRASGEPLMFTFRFPGGSTSSSAFGTSTTLISVVPHLARSDFARTISLLRSMRLQEPRALAIIAACRAINPTPRKRADPKKPEPGSKVEERRPDKSPSEKE